MSCVTILRLMSSLRKASSQSSSAEILRRPASASGTLVGVVQVDDDLLEVGQREGVEDVELPLGVVADVAEWGTSYAVSFFIDSTSIALSSFAYIRMIITITHNHKQHPRTTPTHRFILIIITLCSAKRTPTPTTHPGPPRPRATSTPGKERRPASCTAWTSAGSSASTVSATASATAAPSTSPTTPSGSPAAARPRSRPGRCCWGRSSRR